MSHQEKQRIFDQYAKSKGHLNWKIMQDAYAIDIKEEVLQDAGVIMRLFMIHVLNACDLVQEEQQKRIAASLKNVEVAESTMHEYADEIGMMDEEECIQARKKVIKKNKEFLKSIKSITNPENKIH